MGNKQKAPEETAEQRELASIAAESYDDWRERWLPLQTEFFEDMQDVESRRMEAMGSANVDYEQAFGQAQQGLERNLMSGGGSGPGSGRFAMGLGGFANDRASSMGQGMADVDSLIDDQYAAGLQTLVNIGRGERAGALQGMSNAADAAQAQSWNDANAAFANRAGNANAIGSAAGMAAAYGLRGMGSPQIGSEAWGKPLGLSAPISSNGPTVQRFNF